MIQDVNSNGQTQAFQSSLVLRQRSSWPQPPRPLRRCRASPHAGSATCCLGCSCAAALSRQPPLTYELGDGRVTFTNVGSRIQVIPQELRELAFLRHFEDETVLNALADRFVQQEFQPGDILVEKGNPADQIVLIAHGKVSKIGTGKYGDEQELGVLIDGDHFTYQAILESEDVWDFTIKAITRCTVLALTQNL